MKRFLKILFCVLYCIGVFLIVLFPVAWDYLVFYDIGEISESSFYFYLRATSFGVIVTLSTMSLFLGILIVYFIRLKRSLRQEPSVGFFEKFGPYGFALFLLTSPAVKVLDKNSKISTSSPFFHAKNGVTIYRGIEKDVIRDFTIYLFRQAAQFEYDADEAETLFGQLIEGKISNINSLQNTLSRLETQEQIYREISNKTDQYVKNISDLNGLKKEFNNFTLTNERAQTLPSLIVSGIVEAFYYNFEDYIKNNGEAHKIASKYIFLIFEVGKELCELLLEEYGRYAMPNKEIVEEFKNASVSLISEKLGKKLDEIFFLQEKISELQEKRKEALQKLGLGDNLQ